MPQPIGCLLFGIFAPKIYLSQAESVDVRGPWRIREDADGKEKWLDSVAGIDLFATLSM
jgi:hypothetical protein